MTTRDIRRQTLQWIGPFFWLLLAAGLFLFLWHQTVPPPEVSRQIRAAGPGGVTAYFRTPEQAVTEINQMLAERAFTRLAQFCDLTGSRLTTEDLTSGAYFTGEPVSPLEPAGPRPFPQGYRFLYSEPGNAEGIIRVVVTAELAAPAEDGEQSRISFLMRRAPEGYRLITFEAAGALTRAGEAP